MLPILFHVGPIKIYTFGTFLVLAFFWGCFFLWKNIQITSYKEEEIFDLLFLSLIGGLFVGRLAYVILNFSSFGFSLLRFLLINGYPGISIMGVMIGSFLTAFLYLSVKKKPFLEIMDYAAAPMFLALFFGKLGAFFSAAEVGGKTNSPFSVYFIGFSDKRYPTPLYEALLFLIGAFFAQKILLLIRRERLEKGMGFYFFLWYFSLVYYKLDALKQSRLLIGNLSFNQALSFVILLTFTVYFLYYFREEELKVLDSLQEKAINYGSTIFHRAVKASRKKANSKKRDYPKTDKGTKGK